MPKYSFAQRDFSRALGRFLRTERDPIFQAHGLLAYASHLLRFHGREELLEKDVEALFYLNRVNNAPVLECPFCELGWD